MTGLYVHIPFCRRKCRYCSFVSGCDLTLIPRYIDCLIQEIVECNAPSTALVDSIFFGGGTPSLLTVDQFDRILAAIKGKFALTNDCEITTEANPDSLTLPWLKGVRSLGFNRISIGVQSLDDDCLSSIGRLHDKEQAIRAIQESTKVFDNVNADYMVGLPSQTPERVGEEIGQLIDLGIKHLSCYSLILEEDTPICRDVAAGRVRLPDEDQTVDLYERASETLAAHGLYRYEISNFAYPGYECRHNANCWRMHPYYGFGAAAHSFVEGLRYYNMDSVREYIAKIEMGESTKRSEGTNTRLDRINETIMLALRTTKGLDIASFNDQFGVDFITEYADVLAHPTVHRVCCIADGYLRINPTYLYVSNQVCLLFLK